MTAPKRSLGSEDVYGEKWDRCLTDTIVKTGRSTRLSCSYANDCYSIASGLALGIVFSAVLFKRKFMDDKIDIRTLPFFFLPIRSPVACFLRNRNRSGYGIQQLSKWSSFTLRSFSTVVADESRRITDNRKLNPTFLPSRWHEWLFLETIEQLTAINWTFIQTEICFFLCPALHWFPFFF